MSATARRLLPSAARILAGALLIGSLSEAGLLRWF